MGEHEKLRQEFVNGSFRKILADNIPAVCCNCGCTENVEYHHVVPLFRGGTNKLSNIVPLCNQCHKAVHMGQHISQYKNHSHTGRPKRWLLTPEREEILWHWAKGEIGTIRFRELLGMGHRVQIKHTMMYQDFIKKHGIDNIKNTYDAVLARFKLTGNYKSSEICYTDGHTEIFHTEIKGASSAWFI